MAAHEIQETNFLGFLQGLIPVSAKSWVVMSGVRYGVDFVARRIHPTPVDSEFSALVLSEGDGCANEKLRVWSDIHCTARLCSGVVKTLLVLEINKNGHGVGSPPSVEDYSVSERTITRWLPERCREGNNVVKSDLCLRQRMKTSKSDFTRFLGVLCNVLFWAFDI